MEKAVDNQQAQFENLNIVSSENELHLRCGDSSLCLQANGEIVLETKKARLHLLGDGTVHLQGALILQKADNDILLQANKNIHLNSQES